MAALFIIFYTAPHVEIVAAVQYIVAYRLVMFVLVVSRIRLG